MSSFRSLVFGSIADLGKKLPELCEGLPSKFEEGTAVFDRRLKEQFPPGSEVSLLVSELAGQGFKRQPVYQDMEGALFEIRRFPFKTFWSVRWRMSGGQIEDIWGVYGTTGP